MLFGGERVRRKTLVALGVLAYAGALLMSGREAMEGGALHFSTLRSRGASGDVGTFLTLAALAPLMLWAACVNWNKK